jgi:hypothetical protein
VLENCCLSPGSSRKTERKLSELVPRTVELLLEIHGFSESRSKVASGSPSTSLQLGTGYRRGRQHQHRMRRWLRAQTPYRSASMLGARRQYAPNLMSITIPLARRATGVPSWEQKLTWFISNTAAFTEGASTVISGMHGAHHHVDGCSVAFRSVNHI